MLGDTAVAVNPDDDRYKDVVGKYVILPLVNKEIPIIADDYVTIDFGSGAVKITPASDPNDFAIAQRHNLEIIKIIDGTAILMKTAASIRARIVTKPANKLLTIWRRAVISSKPNLTPIMSASATAAKQTSNRWFPNSGSSRSNRWPKQAIAAVVKGKTRIVPATWEATYFEWMNNIRDWCISRQTLVGAPDSRLVLRRLRQSYRGDG